jgi:hypothetical protein
MQRFGKWIAGLAAVVLAAGCGGDGSGGGGITPTGPMLLVGPTATVTVNCPTQMETGTSSTCTAYGYDANGSFTSSSVSSWSSSNTSVATIGSTGGISAVAAGRTTITAVVDGISGSTRVLVVNPPQTLTVSIGGSTTIPPNQTCGWWTSVSGGTGPYSYYWYGGAAVSARDQYDFYGGASVSFLLQVKVTDANGNVAWGSQNITVSSSSFDCMI